eukprot:c12785_g1_i4.p1 GENE.c12785_g1_i4~~c12785_g1_i4.p1  ORF type:complete len:150 (+),score=13.79 c12785_g1_i4:131-580(+)
MSASPPPMGKTSNGSPTATISSKSTPASISTYARSLLANQQLPPQIVRKAHRGIMFVNMFVFLIFFSSGCATLCRSFAWCECQQSTKKKKGTNSKNFFVNSFRTIFGFSAHLSHTNKSVPMTCDVSRKVLMTTKKSIEQQKKKSQLAGK